MKKLIIALICLTLAFSSGCHKEGPTSGETVPGPQPSESGADGDYGDFEIQLFSDKPAYKTTEEIKIWATLQYAGDSEQVTIWHGDPSMVFSITDGKNFNVDGVVATLLTSTVLNKDEIYRFDYEKSGGYGEDDPDADFWRDFYKEERLLLPAGEYTVSVRGAFSLSEDTRQDSNLRREIKIEVTS